MIKNLYLLDSIYEEELKYILDEIENIKKDLNNIDKVILHIDCLGGITHYSNEIIRRLNKLSKKIEVEIDILENAQSSAFTICLLVHPRIKVKSHETSKFMVHLPYLLWSKKFIRLHKLLNTTFGKKVKFSESRLNIDRRKYIDLLEQLPFSNKQIKDIKSGKDVYLTYKEFYSLRRHIINNYEIVQPILYKY